MRDRSGEDFSDVITDLSFSNPDIVPVPKKFTNSAGAYFNPNAKEGFQYVAAFVTKDGNRTTWIETFGVEKVGTKMVIRGRCGSKFMPEVTSQAEIRQKASEMIEAWLKPERS